MKILNIIFATTVFLFTTQLFAVASPTGIIVGPLHGLLATLAGLVPNVGLAIIFLTIAVRLLLSPLQFVSIKSMKKMELIQPRLAKIKEKFATHPDLLRQETMNLFKSESVSPLGCIIPMLVQLPLFYAFFTVLKESPLVTNASFVGWISDLSIADPYFILPILAGIVQLLVMYKSKSSSAPGQMGFKGMALTSATITFVMFGMPAGVLLYSITGSIVSLLERVMITKLIA